MAAKSNPVNWFEIPADDLGRAKAFYEHILGVQLTLNEVGPLKLAFFPMEEGVTGIGGMLVKSEVSKSSSPCTLVYFSVDDIEGVLKRINEKGGKTVAAKQSIGEYGFMGLFEDTEGNRVGLHSMK